jgi:hypothetical protein
MIKKFGGPQIKAAIPKQDKSEDDKSEQTIKFMALGSHQNIFKLGPFEVKQSDELLLIQIFTQLTESRGRGDLMKALLILTITMMTSLASADVCWTEGDRPVVHQLKGDETLWFVSQLYYTHGALYTKIMLANAIRSQEDVQKGMFLYIPDPLHNPFAKNFSARYKALYRERAILLAKQHQKRAIAKIMKKPTPIKRGVASFGRPKTLDPEQEGIKRLKFK